MTGDIVKLKSGKQGVSWYNDQYVLVPKQTDTVIPTLDPIEEYLPRTKDTILSVAECLPKLGILGGLSSGSDPEIFVFDKEGDVIPAWKFLPEKSKGLKAQRGGYTSSATPHVRSYWDGAQAEITIDGPEHCHAQLVDSLQAGIRTIYNAAQAYSPGAVLRTSDIVKIDEKTLVEADDVHVQLGCAPSANAYKNIHPIRIEDPRMHPLRYSGCHLHYRLATVKKDGKLQTAYGINIPNWFPGGTIKMMDRILGLMLTALGRDMEDPQRRVAYGRPGEYRQTAAGGLEYRTPGSFLLCRPEVMNFALDMGRRAFGLGILYDPETFFLPGAKDIIMSCDADEAVKRIEKFAPFFESMIANNNGWNVKGTMHILKKGLKACGLVKDVAEMWYCKQNQVWGSHNNGDRSDFRALSNAAATL